ncbi:hypothetical protein JG687_00014271 [Phytophthora cactorum]|uniref:Uncharacterized protein n=2 Tax=Phytophthora cactorum TaxID=29920 RepID=A0A329T1I0_9STRA|nr:hypothetical protein PC120_g5283 [Phytophthora cactorum]KAG4242501.1 hypothetical protein PC116_g9570 [Phytophthora cactorum]KAG6950416.1 hypothetical protein JG687_00014271 [Phytophthora cactorum]RAW42539.1 hypothetical protein PC110_g1307 [Phytophthora cactorum]
MGHANALSRLCTVTVSVLTMSDLLNSHQDDRDDWLQAREQDDAFDAAENDGIIPVPGLIEVREHGTVIGDGDGNNVSNHARHGTV